MANVEEERRLIKDWQTWPMYPRLPMKNPSRYSDNTNDLGSMLASDVHAGNFIVYLGNPFNVKNKEQMLALSKEEFGSIEALLEAGWIVD